MNNRSVYALGYYRLALTVAGQHRPVSCPPVTRLIPSATLQRPAGEISGLDQQREKLLPQFDFLKGMIAFRREGLKAQAEYLVSDEGQKQFESLLLRQDPLVLRLGDIASQIARSDGWASLGEAENLVRQNALEELKLLRERLGQKTLKALILATEFFDVLEETTNRGRIRVLYRLKSEFSKPANVTQ